MEPSLPTTNISQNSKKRGSAVSFMDAEVVEIPPPPPRSSKSQKKKEVIFHEVIDIDNDEDCSDLATTMIEVNKAKKGKAIVDLSEDYSHDQEKPFAEDLYIANSMNGVNPHVMEEGLHASFNVDGLNYDYFNDDDYMDDLFVDDMMGVDEYDQLQAHFDNMDIPPGVEAPVPWLSDVSNSGKNSHGVSSSSYISGSSVQTNLGYFHEETKSVASEEYMYPQKTSSTLNSPSGSYAQPHPAIHHSGQDPSTPAALPNGPGRKNRSGSQHSGSSRNFSFGLESFKSRRLLEPFSKNKKAPVSSSSSNNFSLNPFDTVKHLYGVEFSGWEQTTLHGGNMQPGFSSSASYPRFPAPIPFVNKPTPLDPFHSHWSKHAMSDPYQAKKYHSYVEPFSPYVHVLPEDKEERNSPQGSITDQGSWDISDVMRRTEQFKKFDTVQDHSDHHHSASGSSGRQPSRSWAKKIQEEWKILEKDLPDTIFVRVYETRMDLLRAVILGAEGTPYHDGLFFFDVFFPSEYPNIPPEVYYHSGGLRLNPNLYNNGKVCLSLLNTWSGDKNEKWQPGLSTMLQVLVSIQGLILNAKPYFNEPGCASMGGTPNGEQNSLKYNEDTFILSLRTMTYTMRKPPKYFEDLVVGHFINHAKDILVACRAYMDGAQVGCLVKGVQDLDEGDKSCSAQFKMTLSGYLNILVKEFTKLGVKDIDTFLPPPPLPPPLPPPVHAVPVNHHHQHHYQHH